MFVTPSAPHSLYVPAPRHLQSPVPAWSRRPGSYETRRDKPAYVRRRRPLPLSDAAVIRTQQYRTLRAVDDLVARLFATLSRLREGSSKMACCVSDNGYQWGEHGLLGKTYPYTESNHVPFYWWWPNHVAGGRVDRRLVTLADIAPTVLQDALVIPDLGTPVDGRSLHRGGR